MILTAKNFQPHPSDWKRFHNRINRVLEQLPYNSRSCGCVAHRRNNLLGIIRCIGLQGEFSSVAIAPNLNLLAQVIETSLLNQAKNWIRLRFNDQDRRAKAWYSKDIRENLRIHCKKDDCPIFENCGIYVKHNLNLAEDGMELSIAQGAYN